MEKRALLAVVLSLLVLFLYQYFIDKNKTAPVGKDMQQPEIFQKEEEESIKAHQEERALPETRPRGRFLQDDEVKKTEEKEILVTTDLYTAIFTTRGAELKSLRLQKYKDKIGDDAQDIELIASGESEEYSLGFEFSKGSLLDLGGAVFKVDNDSLSVIGVEEQGAVLFTWVSPQGIEVVKKFSFSAGSYVIDLEVNILNLSATGIKEDAILSWKNQLAVSEDNDRFSFSGPVALVNGELEEIKVKKLDNDKIFSGKVSWAGYEDKYFISSIIPGESWNGKLKISKSSKNLISVEFIEPVTVNQGARGSYSYSLYSGPKDLDRLKNLGFNLDKALNFGWFDIIAKPLLIFLKFINKYVGNYGVAIILLTVVIKIIFFPLTHHSYKSMKDMQKVQPLMAKLKEKHKDDKAQMNKEVMALYRTHKVNPMGGCLPMVLQIPVFFALYKALLGSIELRHAPFIFWINDLSAKDPSYITPLLMGASMFIQQKMTPTVGDPTQAKMMLIMPIVFTFMFLNFPSGLVIYWLVNNILSIGQQYYINKSPTA